MGQTESQTVCQLLVKSQDASFVIVSNALPEALQFNPAESRLIRYGIDKQTSPSFQHKTLSSVTVDDAEQIKNAFLTVGAIFEHNAYLYAASRQTDCSTANGMKETF